MSYEILNHDKDPSVKAIVDSLEDNKAENISVISLKGKAEFAEFMIVASGRSNKHVDSVSDKVYRYLKKINFIAINQKESPFATGRSLMLDMF